MTRQYFSRLPSASLLGALFALVLTLLIAAGAHPVAAAAGDLDTTFDSDGKVLTDVGGNDGAYSVAIQSDGKIVVAGWANDTLDDDDFALVRYNTDGSLDTAFGSDGKVTTDIDNSREWAYSVAIQSDGKIVVAGETLNGGDRNFALVRYMATPPAAPSASGSQWAMAAPMRPSSQHATITKELFQDGSSGFPETEGASRHIAWRCKPASSIYAARKPTATSALPRFCSPI